VIGPGIDALVRKNRAARGCLLRKYFSVLPGVGVVGLAQFVVAPMRIVNCIINGLESRDELLHKQ
jgi:hypothetical protein